MRGRVSRVNWRDLFFLAAGIVAASAVFSLAAWLFRVPAQAPAVAATSKEPVVPLTPFDDPAPQPAIDALANCLSTANAELERVRAERAQEWEQTAALVDALLEAGQLEAPGPAAEMREIIQRMRKRFQADADEWFGNLDEFLFFAAIAGSNGPEARQEILRTIRDPAADYELRGNLLTSLSLIPTRDSLELLLNPPADLMEDYNVADTLGGMAMISNLLPQDQVTPFLPKLFDAAMLKLDESPEEDDAWSLLGVLALDFGYPPALAAVNDPDNFGLFGGELLEMAWWIGTDRSRTVVEQLSRSHPDPEIRNKALKILAEW